MEPLSRKRPKEKDETEDILVNRSGPSITMTHLYLARVLRFWCVFMYFWWGGGGGFNAKRLASGQ